MEIQSLKKDAKKIEAGEWVDNIPGFGDARVRVRGLTAPLVVTYRSRLERKVPRAEREPDGSLKHTAGMRVLATLLADVVLLEWEGFTQDGKEVPYSKEQATKWLTDPDYITFADGVVWAANVVDRQIKGDQEDLEKNSPRPSTSPSGSETPAA